VARDYEEHNRAFWDADADDYQAVHGGELAASPRAWGTWRVSDGDAGVLGDQRDRDVLEYGCGAAQWAVALALDGARVVGLDLSSSQLHHARSAVRGAGVRVPLVQASGEAVPFADASFDVVFCDHGAMSFCDPERGVAEAARLLRPGGMLAFCHTTPLKAICDDGERTTRRLHQDYFGMRRFDWQGEGTIDFQATYSEWVRLFRACGLLVDDLVELRPPEGATTTFSEFVDYDWARRWPAEEIWVLRKPLTSSACGRV
jgi:SAM-dependent methyltransferase